MLTEQSLRAQAHVMNTNLWIKFLWAHSLSSSSSLHHLSQLPARSTNHINLLVLPWRKLPFFVTTAACRASRESVCQYYLSCVRFAVSFPEDRRPAIRDTAFILLFVQENGLCKTTRIINYSTFPVPLGCRRRSCSSTSSRTVAHEKYPIQESFASPPPSGGPSALSHMFRDLNTLQLLPLPIEYCDIHTHNRHPAIDGYRSGWVRFSSDAFVKDQDRNVK